MGTNKSIDREASLYKTKWTTTALVGQVKVSMAKMAIYGPLAIGPWAINSSKWGIPEKSYKNVAQQCLLDGCSAFQQDFIANNCISP